MSYDFWLERQRQEWEEGPHEQDCDCAECEMYREEIGQDERAKIKCPTEIGQGESNQ